MARRLSKADEGRGSAQEAGRELASPVGQLTLAQPRSGTRGRPPPEPTGAWSPAAGAVPPSRSPAADACPSGARHRAGTAPGSRDEPRPPGSRPSRWWTDPSQSCAPLRRPTEWLWTDLRSQLPGPSKKWARLLEELAARLDRGTIYDRQLPAMRPAVAALVDSFNRRWS